jgi:hypothetical protein
VGIGDLLLRLPARLRTFEQLDVEDLQTVAGKTVELPAR